MTEGDGGDSLDGSGPSVGERPPVLIDVMCGKLATYLRLCGYDAAYALDRGVEADDRLLSLAAAEGRVLVTRDRDLAARAPAADPAVDSVLLAERDVLDQLRELDAAGFPAELADEPTRCGACNGPVERVASTANESDDDPVAPADRPDYVPDEVGAARPGWRCTDCGQWFWKGGHWDDVAARLDRV
ncbi:Mut7-C RNAse domain-containing protein [Halorubrum ejinorense]|uniref:Mut7-C RNAse domain-containing protein n=1 Tax=Halorubrum ejinorense TaxID=425309 RepID=A0AAV3SPZ0_9EURY